LEAHSRTDLSDHNEDSTETLTYQIVSLAKRISKLEHNKCIRHEYNPKKIQEAGQFLCPDKHCGRKYAGASDLGKHCQQKHELMGLIVSQRVCYRCREPFPTTRDLILHEKAVHHEVYDLRIEAFLPLFTLYSGRLTWYHFVRDLRVVLGMSSPLSLFSPPSSDSQSSLNNRSDRAPTFTQGNHLAGRSRYNEFRSSYHHSEVDNPESLPASAPLPEINQQLQGRVHGTEEAVLPGIGQAKVQHTMGQDNDVDLYKANGQLDVGQLLFAFENENHQKFTDHSEIGQDCHTALYDIDTFLSSSASNSESSNTMFAGFPIDDTPFYSASNELDSEDFPSDLLDLLDPQG
jgi:hypothetical protein